MSNVFLACENNFPRTISRSRAKGYKSLKIDDDIEQFSKYEIVTEGDTLRMKKVETDEDPDSFTILCKEFGLDDMKTNFDSKISVIFLDNSYMLVTLHSGAFCVNIEDENGNLKLTCPNIGVEEFPEFNPDSLLWVDMERIMSFSNFMTDSKNLFLYDFEFFFMVGGHDNGNQSFRLRLMKDSDIDMSFGAYANYLEQREKHKEFNSANKIINAISKASSDSAMEFDDSDDDYEDWEEDDDY